MMETPFESFLGKNFIQFCNKIYLFFKFSSPNVLRPPDIANLYSFTVAGLINQSPQKRITMLQTALVLVINDKNKVIPLRALLDTGANVNVISEAKAREIGNATFASHLQLSVVGGNSFFNPHQMNLQIKSRYKEHFSAMITCVILPQTTSPTPYQDIEWRNFSELENHVTAENPCFLADPNFHRRGNIDIIFNSSMFFDSLKGFSKTISLQNGVTFIETAFGYIATGEFNDVKES